MKLKRLHIHNLASIEDAVIEFDRSPLKDEALFLICGETGSGKSTITDAICLALYGNTPRFRSTAAEKYIDPTNPFNRPGNESPSNDKRQILRRNTRNGWSELHFTGSDGIEYVARWEVYMSRNNILQDTIWTLSDLTHGHTYSKKGEVASKISDDAVGLDFDQFCRTAILAQGEFTKFLKSPEKEKADILEKLTGTETYSRIGRKIYEKTQNARAAYENAKKETENIPILSEEDKASLESSLAGSEKRLKEISSSLSVLTAAYEWHSKQKEYCSQLEDSRSKLMEISEKIASDGFRSRKDTLDKWEASVEARHRLNVCKNIRERLKQNEIRMAGLGPRLAEIRASLKTVTESDDRVSAEVKADEEYITSKERDLGMFRASQTIIAALKGILRRKDDISATEKSISVLDEELKERNNAVRKASAENERCRLEFEAAEEKMREAASLYEASGHMALTEARDTLSRNRGEAEKIQLLIHSQEKTKEEIASLRTRIERNKEILASALSEKSSLETGLRLHRAEYEAAESAYRKMCFSLEDSLKAVRSTLQAGDTCPLCGHVIEAMPSDKDFEETLLPLKKIRDEKERQYKASTERLANSSASIRSLEESIKETESSLAKMLSSYDEAASGIDSMAKALEISLTGKEAAAAVESYLKELALRYEENRISLENAEKLKAQLESCKATTNSLKEMHLRLTIRQKETESRKDATETEIRRLKENISKSISLNMEEMTGLEAHITYPEWKASFESSPEEFILRLNEDSVSYTAADTRIRTGKELLARNANIISQVSSSIEEMENIYPGFRMCHTTESRTAGDIINAAKRLSQEAVSLSEQSKNLESELASTEKELHSLMSGEDKTGELEMLDSIPQDAIASLRQEINTAFETLNTCSALCRMAESNLSSHLARKPEGTETADADTLESSIRSMKEEEASIYQERGAVLNRLEQNEKNLKSIRDRLVQISLLEEKWHEWDMLCTEFGDATGANFRRIAQSYVLQELLFRANSYLGQLTDRYELESQPGILTLLFRDKYQGGALRPVSTLSGGESFIFSLALALGLSSLNKSGISIDTLFIDEGFGTLSEDYLDTAINVLERLHGTGGRRVGIISHVDKLRERIRTQIQVTKTDLSKSEIRTVQI